MIEKNQKNISWCVKMTEIQILPSINKFYWTQPRSFVTAAFVQSWVAAMQTAALEAHTGDGAQPLT